MLQLKTAESSPEIPFFPTVIDDLKLNLLPVGRESFPSKLDLSSLATDQEVGISITSVTEPAAEQSRLDIDRVGVTVLPHHPASIWRKVSQYEQEVLLNDEHGEDLDHVRRDYDPEGLRWLAEKTLAFARTPAYIATREGRKLLDRNIGSITIRSGLEENGQIYTPIEVAVHPTTIPLVHHATFAAQAKPTWWSGSTTANQAYDLVKSVNNAFPGNPQAARQEFKLLREIVAIKAVALAWKAAIQNER